MAIRPLPPLKFLRECFSYDPQTGKLLWRTRPESHFDTAAIARAWNGRLAGAEAFQARTTEGYRMGELKYEGQRYHVRAHRVVFKLMNGRDPKIVDHINGDESDNRWENLREATDQQNQFNRSRRGPRTLPKCVYFDRGGYVSRVTIGPKKHYLGRYDTPEQAHAAFCAFASQRHGEFFNPG